MDEERRRKAGFLAARWHELQVVWRLMADPEVSVLLKLIPLAALLYFFFPLDLINDLLLGPGQLDDVGLLLLALAAFVKMAPPARVAKAQEGAPRAPLPPSEER